MIDRPLPTRVAQRERGFFRYDYTILAAILCLVLAVVVPQAHKHGLKGALVALAGVGGVLAGGLGLLIGGSWLLDRKERPGWGDWVRRGFGHVFGFCLFGLLASAVAAALVGQHGLSPAAENRVALCAGILGGLSGERVRHRLGPERFWPAFGLLGFALLGSLLGGILGILGPGNWGVDIGVLTPLLIFAALSAAGRIGRPAPTPTDRP